MGTLMKLSKKKQEIVWKFKIVCLANKNYMGFIHENYWRETLCGNLGIKNIL